MSSTNKTSLGLNMWEASDKPVRQDFVNDNTIIDDKITQLNSNLDNANSNLALKANASDLSNVSSAVTKIHDLSNVGYVTNFNGGGLANTPGRWNVYNISGTDANAPYSGAVAGYVEVLINGDTAVAGNVVYQTLHDHWGDVYTKIIVAGSSYGTWKKLTP